MSATDATEKIRKALELHLAAMTPAVPIAFENATYTPVSGIAYQRANMIYGEPDDRVMGCARRREIGIFQVTLCYPTSLGNAACQARAELIRDRFKKLTTLQNGGQYVQILKTPKKQTLGIDGDRYNVAVSISYTADVFG